MKRGDRIQVPEVPARNSEALRHNIITRTSHEVFFTLVFSNCPFPFQTKTALIHTKTRSMHSLPDKNCFNRIIFFTL